MQEEQMKSISLMPQDVTENCTTDERPEKASVSVTVCGSVETSQGVLSTNSDARKKASVSSKKTATECASSVENSSGVSGGSVSNATVSGTPPQPASRRQTFITLEKFDGSENRPFSSSPLNNMSSVVTVKNNQEGMTKTDIPVKTKKREGLLSKPESEKIVHGNKRSGLRSSKVEQTVNKRTKPLLRSEQEKNTQESIDGMAALENNPPGLFNQTECVLDNQPHFSESTMQYEDTILKPTVENAVLLENSTIEEKTIGTNLESKENTPPALIPADQMVNEDSPIQITPNQKTLRRSLRRRSEIAEPTTDSQDKENNHQKKERRREEEKTLQKSPLHIKDDELPKQKLTSEQTVQENLIEKDTLHEKTSGETSTNAEIDKTRRKPDLENIKSEGDGAQDTSEKSSEKPVRGRTRYQTRRASQGLLSSIENSESDSSEAKEEGSRKKRSGKWKNKNSDSVDIEDQEEKMVKQDCVKVENQTHDYKANSEVDINIKSQICEIKDENNTVTLQNVTISPELLLVSDDLSDACEGKSKTDKCAEYFFSNSPVPELNLRTRNASKRSHKRDSVEHSVGACPKPGTTDITLPSEKAFQTPECRHKRSRRVRRSKSCDCCGEKPLSQEKPSVGLTNTENDDAKVNEAEKGDVQVPGTVSETAKAHLDSEVKLDEHDSVNFHLGLKEGNDISESLAVPETELKENIQDSLPVEIVSFKEENFDRDSEEALSTESQEPSNKKCKTVGLCLVDSKDISLECSTLETKEEKPEAVLVKEVSTENMVDIEAEACNVKEFNPEEVEAMELNLEHVQSEASFSEEKSAETSIFEEEITEQNSERSDESEADKAAGLNLEEEVTEEFNSATGQPDNTAPGKEQAQIEVSVGGLDGARDQSDPGSSEENNAEMADGEERVIGEVNAKSEHANEREDGDLTTDASKPAEAEANNMNVAVETIVPDTLEMSTEERKFSSNKTETSTLTKPEEAKLDDSQMKVGNSSEILPEICHTSEKGEETPLSLTSEAAVSEPVTEDNDNMSPQKLNEFDPSLLSANDSPSGMQTRCVWSPLASPSSSILKRGLKRPQEDEISSPVNKVGV